MCVASSTAGRDAACGCEDHRLIGVRALAADLQRAEPGWKVVRPRYFNPVNQRRSGDIAAC